MKKTISYVKLLTLKGELLITLRVHLLKLRSDEQFGASKYLLLK